MSRNLRLILSFLGPNLVYRIDSWPFQCKLELNQIRFLFIFVDIKEIPATKVTQPLDLSYYIITVKIIIPYKNILDTKSTKKRKLDFRLLL